MSSVTRPCFTTQHHTCKTKTKTDFLVSDRSCPKTDSLRLHHCCVQGMRWMSLGCRFFGVLRHMLVWCGCQEKTYGLGVFVAEKWIGKVIQIDRYNEKTRSSADADNRLDAFSGQSRSTNMVPFHMLHIVSYCAIVTLYLRPFTIFVFKKFHDLEMGVKGHSRSLRVVSFHRLCMVSY